MKVIITHNSRTMNDIIYVVAKSGSFTAPLGLPHYRYDNTRRNCYALEDAKVIKRIKKVDINVHYSKGDNFQRFIDSDIPAKDFCNVIRKEIKAANPKKPKAIKCRGCGVVFETINYQQKSCKRGCKQTKHLGEGR